MARVLSLPPTAPRTLGDKLQLLAYLAPGMLANLETLVDWILKELT